MERLATQLAYQRSNARDLVATAHARADAGLGQMVHRQSGPAFEPPQSRTGPPMT